MPLAASNRNLDSQQLQLAVWRRAAPGRGRCQPSSAAFSVFPLCCNRLPPAKPTATLQTGNTVLLWLSP